MAGDVLLAFNALQLFQLKVTCIYLEHGPGFSRRR